VSNLVLGQKRPSESKGAIQVNESHTGNSLIKSVGPRPRFVVYLTLCAAIAILLGGLLAGCGSNSSQAPSKEVQAMLQDRFEAMNAGDTQAVAKCYATNAALDNYADQTNLQGATAIADYFGGMFKDFRMQWEAQGDPLQHDKYVIQRVVISQVDGTGTGAAVHILEMDSNGQISHEWIVAWVA